jgi:iron complex transport system substrate-binding protein
LPAVWLVAVALVAACAGPAPTTPPSVNATQVLPSTAGATQAVPTYPLALADDGGTQVTLKALPRSIVSLTPAATETLYALGVGDRLVGKVEDFALYPPEAGSVPDVAKFGSVDVERIVALKADLVIAGGSDFNPPADIARLRSLGIPVLVVYGSKLETALADIDLIGRAVGKPGPAAALVAGLRAAFAQVQSAVKGMPKPRVYYELDATNGYFGPAPDYFGVEMIELAGGAALTSGIPGAFQISEEKIVAFDPEVILLGDAAYGVTVGQVAARPGWAGLAAVRARAIRPVDDVIITRPGPRLGQGLAALALAIHPGLALPSPLGGAFASASPFPSPLPSGSPAR